MYTQTYTTHRDMLHDDLLYSCSLVFFSLGAIIDMASSDYLVLESII